jgi:penicillin-binding protein 1A
MNGMYRPTGGNIDGGTYPADIWGEYMGSVVGNNCHDFKQPTQPFHSQPFFGHYSREGAKDENKDGQTTPGATQPGANPQPEPDQQNKGDSNKGQGNGKKNGGDNRNGNFDPNQYETPPQGPPQTADPGGGTQAPTDG